MIPLISVWFSCNSSIQASTKNRGSSGNPGVLNHLNQKDQCASEELIEYLQKQKITLAFDFQLHFYTGNTFGHKKQWCLLYLAIYCKWHNKEKKSAKEFGQCLVWQVRFQEVKEEKSFLLFTFFIPSFFRESSTVKLHNLEGKWILASSNNHLKFWFPIRLWHS